MKKLSLWIGSAAIAVVVLAFTDKVEGQGKKPPPKIKMLNVDANELFTWRHNCYIEALKVNKPNLPNGGPHLIDLVAAYNKRITEINNFAQTPNQQVNFSYKSVVGANAAAPLSSSVIYVNKPRNYTDSITFVQAGAFLPPVGREVRIVGVYSPLSNLNLNLGQFPPFLNAAGQVIPYQGTQVFLNNVYRPK